MLGTKNYALASHLNRALSLRRATTRGAQFVYQGERIARPERAYAFRAISPAWLARDPLAQGRFEVFIQAVGLPANNAAYQRGKITCTDWKPITGENAWAFFIGPLQAAQHHVCGVIAIRSLEVVMHLPGRGQRHAFHHQRWTTHVEAQPFELVALVRLDVEARVQRESTGLRGAATIALLLSLFPLGRHSLQ